jgi:hypothetical protein
MNRTFDLNAAPDLHGVGAAGAGWYGGVTESNFTPVRPDCQTLGALLESEQELEDLHAGAIAFHWPRFLAARARRSRLERMIFAGGVR